MKKFLKPVCWFVVLLFLAECVSASKRDSIPCTCNKDDYSPAGVMIGMRHLKGMWMFSYNYMNMQMQHNLSGTSEVSDETILNSYIMSPHSMRMDMHMLMGMYGLSDRITLMAMLNYNSLNMQMNMLSASHTQMSGTMHNHNHSSSSTDTGMDLMEMESKSSGIGDSKLFALWSFYVHKGSILMASGGVNIPTGSINKKGLADDMMYADQNLPYMMQTGSGTFDFSPGLTFLQKGKNYECSAQATGVLRTYNNSNSYRLGNELALNAWGAYQFFDCLSPSLRAEATFSENIKGADAQLYKVMEPDAAPENYGGKKINGYIGLSFYFKKLPVVRNSRLLAEFGVPLYQNVNGIQLSQKSTLSAAWRFAF